MLSIDKKRRELQKMSHEELVNYAIQKEIELAIYMDRLNSQRQKKFGSSSEHTGWEQLNLFNEMEDTIDHAAKEELEEPEKTEKPAGKDGKKKKGPFDFAKLPRKVIEHKLESAVCPDCGAPLKELKPEIIQVLKYEPAKYYIEEHVVHNYVCPACTEREDAMKTIKAEGAPARLIEKSMASSSVVAAIAYNKFMLGMPLYRQEGDLIKRNAPIPRQNMSNWLMRCSEDYLRFVFDAMLEDLRKQEVVHMDETTLAVIEDKRNGRQKDYEWLAMSGRYEEKQMALYFFSPSREYACVERILGEGNRSIIHSDGYGAYHGSVGKMTVGCMAHARRKFMDCEKIHPCSKEYKKLKSAREREAFLAGNPDFANLVRVLEKINKLFEIERSLNEKKAKPEEILERRQKVSAPIFDDLFAFLGEIQDQYLPKGNMGMAIKYALDEKPYLENYLKDGRLEISNNRAERKIKPFVIARKNFLFSCTRSGARSSSIYFSLLESAKMNGLKEERYLTYVLDVLSQKGLTEQNIQDVLPYSKKLPKELYINKTHEA